MNQAFSQILQTKYNGGRVKGKAEDRAEENAQIQEIPDLLLMGKSNSAIVRARR